MTVLTNYRNRWVLITGASSGLGYEIARQMAIKHGANLILTARREERLSQLRDEILQTCNVQVETIAADLSRPEDVQNLYDKVNQGRMIDGVILNAGVTYFGHVLDQSYEDFESMLATNVRATVCLSQSFGRHWRSTNQSGSLMLVASLAGMSPLPYQATYAASKAFLISYGASLAYELESNNISVTVFAPGGISTEMLDKSGLSRAFKPDHLGMMDVRTCAHAAISAMNKGRGVYVPGWINRVAALALKWAPRGISIRQSAAIYRKALPKN